VKEAPVKKLFQNIVPSEEAMNIANRLYDPDDKVWCFASYNEEDDIWEPDGDTFFMTDKEMVLFKLKNEGKILDMTHIWGMTVPLVVNAMLDRGTVNRAESMSELQTAMWRDSAFASILKKNLIEQNRFKKDV
tara:strand:+ start:232 stop:630 length:399 start_codon:yes stop_codon:yes gene_type:complete